MRVFIYALFEEKRKKYGIEKTYNIYEIKQLWVDQDYDSPVGVGHVTFNTESTKGGDSEVRDFLIKNGVIEKDEGAYYNCNNGKYVILKV